MSNKHTIHSHSHHFGWDNSIESILTVAPGESVEFGTIDASGGQLNRDSSVEDVTLLDFDKVNPVTGPIVIDGAKPGDTLKITIESFSPSGWGWTAIIPGFGLLSDQFQEPDLHIWSYNKEQLTPCAYGPGGKVPLKPFCGTIGVALAEQGTHSIVPPRRVGGNMDIRDLSSGTVLYLPIEVNGAMFSVGDTHAAQGDGEVCGTAIESPMDVTLNFEIIKDENLMFPHFETPGPVTRHLDEKGYHVTTGIGDDLMVSAKQAVSGMIDSITSTYGINPSEAYMLCSVCADLRISEIVDQPNWVVSLYFPKMVFE